MVEQAVRVRRYGHLIGGEWVDASSGETIARNNPATGAPVAEFAAGTPDDTKRAVDAARTAFDSGPWPRMSGAERGKLLYGLAQRISEETEALARIEVEEVGKTIRFAKGDVEGTAGIFEYAAGLAPQVHGEVYGNLGENYNGTVVREPIGVVGMIIPWNFPSLILAQKLPFALATGCTAVVKPSEFTSGTALEIGRMAQEVGIPDGVVNVVTGEGAETGQVLAESTDVDMVHFTGSTAVGRKVMEAAASNVKKLSLELGGKAANIVFAAADLEDALDGVLFGIYFNQGECCVSGTRLLVEDSVADQFVERLVERSRSLRVGDPTDEATDIGALIREGHVEKVRGYIRQGEEEGARLLTGGDLPPAVESGAFVAPAVFDRVGRDMAIFREEIFGPVLSVTRFASTEEAVELANDTEFGLANSLWTKDLDKAMTVSRDLRAGRIWVNTTIDGGPQLPAGGYKASGFGREMGYAGLEEFTEIKSVLYHLGKREPSFGSDGSR
jgi:betaine-aldehyde dehydrogenase